MTTETREYVCDLSDEELIDRSQEQNQLLYEVAQLEAERRAINLEIKPKNERIDELVYVIRNRTERRDVTCEWHYDWDRGVKVLYRTDTRQEVDRRVIEPHERQQRLEFPVKVDPSLFTGCPSCAYSKTNPCAPVLCGNAHMIHKSIPGPCEHPHESWIEESNVITCGICKTVLDVVDITREMQPVDMEEETANVCLNTDCDQMDKSEPNGCRSLEHVFECESFQAGPCGTCPDFPEQCGSPEDQSKCVEALQEAGEVVPFVIGEKFTPPAAGDDSWPDPPESGKAAA